MQARPPAAQKCRVTHLCQLFLQGCQLLCEASIGAALRLQSLLCCISSSQSIGQPLAGLSLTAGGLGTQKATAQQVSYH
jgi:hypothetical protein